MVNSQPNRFNLTTLGWILLQLIFCVFGYCLADLIKEEEPIAESLWGLIWRLFAAGLFIFLAYLASKFSAMSEGLAPDSNFGVKLYANALCGFAMGVMFQLLIYWLETGKLISMISIEIVLFGIALLVGTRAARWFFR